MDLPPLVIPVDRIGGRNAALLHGAMATGFLAVGAAAWVLPDSIAGTSVGARVAVSVLGLAGATLFGWIAVLFHRRVRSDAPLVVLDPDGLIDHGSGVFSGVGWIPWSDVEEIRPGSYQGLPCVEVVLRDRDTYVRRLPWFDRLGRSARLGYPAVAFRGPLLPDAPERLVEEMRSYLHAVRAKRSAGFKRDLERDDRVQGGTPTGSS